MLGALARRLCALDVDVLYAPTLDAKGRTILTRERRLARNHLLIRSDDVTEQLHQVLTELDTTCDITLTHAL